MSWIERKRERDIVREKEIEMGMLDGQWLLMDNGLRMGSR